MVQIRVGYKQWGGGAQETGEKGEGKSTPPEKKLLILCRHALPLLSAPKLLLAFGSPLKFPWFSQP